MARNECGFAALAIAGLGCTLNVPPTTPGASALGQSPDGAPPAVHSSELPAETSTPAPPTFDPFVNPFARAAPQETERDAQRRRLRGTPADVHTPEGAAHGYQVYRHCSSYESFDVVAVIGTGTRHFPQFGPASPSIGNRSPRELEKEFWAFAQAVRRAAAVSSIHSVAASGQCFGTSSEYAVIVHLHDWRQVDQAIRNVGSWLALHDWNGDVILWLEPIPGPVYSK